MNPLVSVIVPTYNVEKYLNKCIDSIVNQTYTNLEIILVDDGSTDTSSSICDRRALEDSRIRVIHKENQGLGMARNTGIDNATGEYICFIDSDDYLDVSTISKCVEAISRTSAQAALFGLVNVDSNYQIIDKNIDFNLTPSYHNGESFRNTILPELISHDYSSGAAHSYPFSSCTALFSLSLIKDNKLRFLSERDIISEDSYFLFQLYSIISGVVLIPEALYFHFVNTASLTMTYRKDRFDRINDFYIRSKELFSQLNYSDELYSRLIMLYHSFTVSALKQIYASDTITSEKRKCVAEIIKNDTFRTTLSKDVISKEKKSVGLFMNLARYKSINLCYLLLMIKGK